MTAYGACLVSRSATCSAARRSAASLAAEVAGAPVFVLDLDGSYRPVAAESVLTSEVVGVEPRRLHRLAAVAEPSQTSTVLLASLASYVARELPVLALEAGTVIVGDPGSLVASASGVGLALVSRAIGPFAAGPERWPDEAALGRGPAYETCLLALDCGAGHVGEAWARWAQVEPDRWPEMLAARFAHATVRDRAFLLSPWNLGPGDRVEESPEPGLLLNGFRVAAIDLTRFDPEQPWLFDASAPADPRARLSEHPVLAAFCGRTAERLLADPPAVGEWELETTSLGVPIDERIRALYRSASASGETSAVPVPDPFASSEAGELAGWLADPPVEGGVARYLAEIYRERPDLRSAFPGVPGEHTARFVSWARRHAVHEGYPARLIDLCVERAGPAAPQPPLARLPGVNVIGYLRGELGVGESARLMISALEAVGVPCAAIASDVNLVSRQQAPFEGGRRSPAFDTSLLCVNADQTEALAATMPDLLARSYRIGMWYWEVEQFPREYEAAFAHVDEVWVATDFIRAAIAPHSPVPLRVITPPLARALESPVDARAILGLPRDPLFLFSFDYLSTVERKNPIGLVDAFTTAFDPGDGPVLVIKSINSHRRPGDAERLRLRVAGLPHVILIDQYLDARTRDSLVAACDCYVSLHRSEGLGLTMAEAMAWGTPVIATGYGGNLQFMNEGNSYLVPWTPTPIPGDAEPYPPGGIWAEPDLAAAAALMRRVIDCPEEAAARGARAAADIRDRHSAAVAGRNIVERLTEIGPRRRRKSRVRVDERLRSTAVRIRARLP